MTTATEPRRTMAGRSGRWLSLITLGLLFVPSSAVAQDRPMWFAGVAIFADHDSPSSVEASLTAGLGAEVGLRAGSRYSLRFELGVPGWHGGEGLGGSIKGRVVAYSLVVGADLRAGRRAQPAFVLGMSALRQASEGPGAQFSADVSHEVALTTGVEVPLRLTDHAHVVAAVRVYVALRPHDVTGVWIRPHVMLRWTF